LVKIKLDRSQAFDARRILTLVIVVLTFMELSLHTSYYYDTNINIHKTAGKRLTSPFLLFTPSMKVGQTA
jgi:hypothetical protein